MYRKRDYPIEYRAFTAIKTRCNNPRSPAYVWYGAKGVQCLFENFHDFMISAGLRTSEAHSIDRYPILDGNYEAGNVRWATKQQQTLGRCTTVNVRIAEETLCLKYACAKVNVSLSRVSKVYRSTTLSPAEAIKYCLTISTQRVPAQCSGIDTLISLINDV